MDTSIKTEEFGITVKTQWGMSMEGNEQVFTDVLVAASKESDTSYRFQYLEVGIYKCGTMRAVCATLEQLSCKSIAIGVDQAGDPHGVEKDGLLKPWWFGRYGAKRPEENKVLATTAFRSSQDKTLNCIKKWEKFNVAFIDGCHCLACAFRDFVAVEPMIINGGRVIFHDASPKCQGKPQGNWHGHGDIQVRGAFDVAGLLHNSRKGWKMEHDLTDVEFGITVFKRV